MSTRCPHLAGPGCRDTPLPAGPRVLPRWCKWEEALSLPTPTFLPPTHTHTPVHTHSCTLYLKPCHRYQPLAFPGSGAVALCHRDSILPVHLPHPSLLLTTPQIFFKPLLFFTEQRKKKMFLSLFTVLFLPPISSAEMHPKKRKYNCIQLAMEIINRSKRFNPFYK